MGEAELSYVIGEAREEGRRGVVVESQFIALGGRGSEGISGGSGDHEKGGGEEEEEEDRRWRQRRRRRRRSYLKKGLNHFLY